MRDKQNTEKIIGKKTDMNNSPRVSNPPEKKQPKRKLRVTKNATKSKKCNHQQKKTKS